MVVPQSHSEDAVESRWTLGIRVAPRILRAMRPHLPLFGLLAVALAVPTTAAAGVGFGPPQLLAHGDPGAHPYWSGGEPSLTFDPSGDGHAYVTAPQFIPTAVDHALGEGPDAGVGVGVWSSADGGQTFPVTTLTGAANGGGDSDVEVLGDHTVLTADLEAIATAICTSKDFGKTFSDCDNGLATNQEGPENDRQWLTRGTKPGEVYLTYHDFVGGFPIIERSTDGGQSFLPCGTIIDPAGPAAANYTPSGGTLVSKPVVARDGTVYVEFAEPDATASPVGASLDHMYMAVAKGGCTGQTVFEDHLIYENPDADVANIFQATAIDGGGQLYVLFGGHLAQADADRANLYLFTSADGGATWRHVQVNPAGLGANVLPAVSGGLAKGEAVLGWFGSTATDPNDTKAQWRYYSATTFDGGQTFSETTVTPDVIHYGDICTQGVFCGLVPGQPSNRNLADFSSAAVNPRTGCSALAIPGDPYNNRPDQNPASDNFDSSAYTSLQQDRGDCLTAANAGRAAGTVGSGSADGSVVGSGGRVSGCVDRAAPSSRIARKGRIASRHRGLRISGTSRDRGCGAGGAGRVARVRVAVARLAAHRRCRFLRADGTLRPAESCRHSHYLKARGAARWTLRVRPSVPAGRYRIRVRGVDAAGNTERAGRHNLAFVRVR
jgi:hypothetical protein